jgi:hypothetical protein
MRNVGCWRDGKLLGARNTRRHREVYDVYGGTAKDRGNAASAQAKQYLCSLTNHVYRLLLRGHSLSLSRKLPRASILLKICLTSCRLVLPHGTKQRHSISPVPLGLVHVFWPQLFSCSPLATSTLPPSFSHYPCLAYQTMSPRATGALVIITTPACHNRFRWVYKLPPPRTTSSLQRRSALLYFTPTTPTPIMTNFDGHGTCSPASYPPHARI